ncbi:hypothetical protein GFS60_03401 [Rhodococcus sp. WAY2]|nr:hypothetical protein GFS60_03401 [Rhodococcus sp. WAY2]
MPQKYPGDRGGEEVGFGANAAADPASVVRTPRENSGRRCPWLRSVAVRPTTDGAS